VFAGDEYKEKVELEETYEKLTGMLLQKNKTVKKLEQEIRVSIFKCLHDRISTSTRIVKRPTSFDTIVFRQSADI